MEVMHFCPYSFILYYWFMFLFWYFWNFVMDLQYYLIFARLNFLFWFCWCGIKWDILIGKDLKYCYLLFLSLLNGLFIFWFCGFLSSFRLIYGLYLILFSQFPTLSYTKNCLSVNQSQSISVQSIYTDILIIMPI
jgi:hypothetical protein